MHITRLRAKNQITLPAKASSQLPVSSKATSCMSRPSRIASSSLPENCVTAAAPTRCPICSGLPPGSTSPRARSTRKSPLVAPNDLVGRLVGCRVYLDTNLYIYLFEGLEEYCLSMVADPDSRNLKAAGTLSYRRASRSNLTTTIRGVGIPYASLPDLVPSKRTNRPRDQAEAAELEASHATQRRAVGGAGAREVTRPGNGRRTGSRATPRGTPSARRDRLQGRCRPVGPDGGRTRECRCAPPPLVGWPAFS